MDTVELLYSFVVGIASGIVSSVIVTIFYRKRDSERDRQNFFANFRWYISKLLSIESTDIEAMCDFCASEECPHVYKWIHLKKDEWDVKINVDEKLAQLSELLVSYRSDKSDLIVEGKDEREIEQILLEKYFSSICVARTEIRVLTLDILTLGNKTLKKIRQARSHPKT